MSEPLRVAVVGAGHIGGHVAQRLAEGGHRVTLCFSRDADALATLAGEIGASVAEPPAAVAAADVVVFSVPWSAVPAALEEVGAADGALNGKVVVDTTNHFGPGPAPKKGQTAAAFNAARMPGARYTKSFNTLTAAFQRATVLREPPVVQWVCGTEAEARAVTCGLVRDTGFAPVDLGGVETCAVMESPRRPGAVYGEEYRPNDAGPVVAAVRAGEPIPATPTYQKRPA